MEKETKILLGIIGVIVAGMVGLFVVFNQGGSTATVDAGKLVREDNQKKGTGDIQLVEFGDYQCPSCAAAYPITERLLADFDGKLTFVYRNFPLESIHKNALSAAKYAEAAAKQGKFWEMHAKLFEAQNEWSGLGDPAAKFADYARALGMNVDQLKTDAALAAIADTIKRDVDDGSSLGVTGTPSFFVDGKPIAKSDYASLKTAIEAAQK